MEPLKISFPEDLRLWPSGAGTCIGFVDETVAEVAAKLMMPIFVERDTPAILLWLPDIGAVTLSSEDDTSTLSIVIDDGIDPFPAAKIIEDALGGTLRTRWPVGAGVDRQSHVLGDQK